jgi:nucleotide-binding universal stress UspA family protein
MINHILVPLDGSMLAECVLPHVMAMASVMNSRVTLTQVVQHLHNGWEIPIVDPIDWHLRKHESENYIERIASRLQASNLNVERTILVGNPAECIIEYARNNQVDLIALSTHGHSGLSKWNVSSVVQKIMWRSNKSTLLVRAYKSTGAEAPAIRYKRIFAGLDCSARGEYILPLAVILAKNHQSQLILATAIQKPQAVHRFPLSNEDKQLMEHIIEKNHNAASHYFDQLRAQFSSKGMKLKTDIVVGDNAIETLHDLVEQNNADLVMLVAHGHSGGRRWPYGSVTNSFISYGNTPLMIMQDLTDAEIQHTHAEQAVREVTGH